MSKVLGRYSERLLGIDEIDEVNKCEDYKVQGANCFKVGIFPDSLGNRLQKNASPTYYIC
jgi:hypothetical protein